MGVWFRERRVCWKIPGELGFNLKNNKQEQTNRLTEQEKIQIAIKERQESLKKKVGKYASMWIKIKKLNPYVIKDAAKIVALSKNIPNKEIGISPVQDKIIQARAFVTAKEKSERKKAMYSDKTLIDITKKGEEIASKKGEQVRKINIAQKKAEQLVKENEAATAQQSEVDKPSLADKLVKPRTPKTTDVSKVKNKSIIKENLEVALTKSEYLRRFNLVRTTYLTPEEKKTLNKAKSIKTSDIPQLSVAKIKEYKRVLTKQLTANAEELKFAESLKLTATDEYTRMRTVEINDTNPHLLAQLTALNNANNNRPSTKQTGPSMASRHAANAKKSSPPQKLAQRPAPKAPQKKVIPKTVKNISTPHSKVVSPSRAVKKPKPQQKTPTQEVKASPANQRRNNSSVPQPIQAIPNPKPQSVARKPLQVAQNNSQKKTKPNPTLPENKGVNTISAPKNIANNIQPKASDRVLPKINTGKSVPQESQTVQTVIEVTQQSQIPEKNNKIESHEKLTSREIQRQTYIKEKHDSAKEINVNELKQLRQNQDPNLTVRKADINSLLKNLGLIKNERDYEGIKKQRTYLLNLLAQEISPSKNGNQFYVEQREIIKEKSIQDAENAERIANEYEQKFGKENFEAQEFRTHALQKNTHARLIKSNDTQLIYEEIISNISAEHLVNVSQKILSQQLENGSITQTDFQKTSKKIDLQILNDIHFRAKSNILSSKDFETLALEASRINNEKLSNGDSPITEEEINGIKNRIILSSPDGLDEYTKNAINNLNIKESLVLIEEIEKENTAFYDEAFLSTYNKFQKKGEGKMIDDRSLGEHENIDPEVYNNLKTQLGINHNLIFSEKDGNYYVPIEGGKIKLPKKGEINPQYEVLIEVIHNEREPLTITTKNPDEIETLTEQAIAAKALDMLHIDQWFPGNATATHDQKTNFVQYCLSKNKNKSIKANGRFDGYTNNNSLFTLNDAIRGVAFHLEMIAGIDFPIGVTHSENPQKSLNNNTVDLSKSKSLEKIGFLKGGKYNPTGSVLFQAFSEYLKEVPNSEKFRSHSEFMNHVRRILENIKPGENKSYFSINPNGEYSIDILSEKPTFGVSESGEIEQIFNDNVKK